MFRNGLKFFLVLFEIEIDLFINFKDIYLPYTVLGFLLQIVIFKTNVNQFKSVVQMSVI